MKMTTWAKPFLSVFSLTALSFSALSFSAFSLPAVANVNISPLYIHLSDAMSAVKQGDTAKSQPYLTAIEQDLLAMPTHHSAMGQAVKSQLKIAMDKPTLANLEQLSKQLVAFDKEQNPVDYVQMKQRFMQTIMPAYQQLADAVATQDIKQIREAGKVFGKTWQKSEKAVREISLYHYGEFEKAMGRMRVAVLSEPADLAKITEQSEIIGKALKDFGQSE